MRSSFSFSRARHHQKKIDPMCSKEDRPNNCSAIRKRSTQFKRETAMCSEEDRPNTNAFRRRSTQCKIEAAMCSEQDLSHLLTLSFFVFKIWTHTKCQPSMALRALPPCICRWIWYACVFEQPWVIWLNLGTMYHLRDRRRFHCWADFYCFKFMLHDCYFCWGICQLAGPTFGGA